MEVQRMRTTNCLLQLIIISSISSSNTILTTMLQPATAFPIEVPTLPTVRTVPVHPAASIAVAEAMAQQLSFLLQKRLVLPRNTRVRWIWTIRIWKKTALTYVNSCRHSDWSSLIV